jgi:two-component system osmolarity sensor histidine kinase EnvZ
MMQIWPRSLLGRNVMLLITLVLASQVCAFLVFLMFIQKPRVDNAASLVASQIVLVDRLLSAIPQAQRQNTLVKMKGVSDADMASLPIHWQHPNGYIMRRFISRLVAQLPPGVEVRWEEEGPEQRFWVRLRAADTYYWIVLPAVPSEGHLDTWTVISLLFILAAFPILGAYLIHRRIEGPLRRLARAAASVENGAWPEPVPVEGPLELATVAVAFNRMMAALAETEATRAEMLAGISHDIRTPLTKLRMAIAVPEAFDAPIATAGRFIEEIDLIVQQFIDFARGGDSEVAVPGDLNALIEQLAGDYAGLGHPFELMLEPLPSISFRPVSIQRVLMNLMQNAVIYGRVGLRVRTWTDAGFAVVSVEDGGPGVAPALLPLMKQPFRRGSHVNQKGGTGLGLAIAERIARQHGGRLDLRLRHDGGMAVDLRLPCA